MLPRLIERNQFFEAKAVWSRLDLPSAKDKRRFLLAMLPESFVQKLVNVCADHGMELIALFPLAAVLENQLGALGSGHADTVLLAIDLGTALHLILGKGDGTVLFSRTVAIDDPIAYDRTLQEINRTLHFAQQQFGAKVTQMFVSGDNAFKVLKDLPIGTGLKVQPVPISMQAPDYAWRAGTLSPRLPWNLISSAGRIKQRRQQLAAIGIAALFCFSLTSAVLTQISVRAREASVANALHQQQAEDQKTAAERALQNQAARWRAFVQVVGSTNDPPVAELFARYLGTVVPEAIRLTQVDVSRTASGWNCRIEGVTREQSDGFITQMEAFERDLQTGLFKLQVTDSTCQQLLHGTAAPVTKRQTERAFFVTATIP